MEVRHLVKVLSILFGVVIIATLVYPWQITPISELKIVKYTDYLLPSQWGDANIEANVVINFSDNCTVLNSVIKTTIEDVNGKILYTTQETVGIQKGMNEYYISVPTSDVGALEGNDGVLYLKVSADILANCSGTIKEYTGSDQKTIIVNNYKSDADLDLVSITPDFSILKDLDNKKYDITVKVENNGLSNVYDGSVKVLLQDSAGNILEKDVKTFSLETGDEKEIKLTLDLSTVDPGKYKLVVELWRGDILEDRKVYDVGVALYKKKALEFTNFELIPPIVKPGDLVMAKLIVKNNLDRTITVKPVLFSEDLNLYRELQEFTLNPGEAKEFRVVFPVNENEPGNYKVELKFIYDQYKSQTYEFYVVIPGKQKIVELSVSGPTQINVSGEGILTLSIRSLVEDLVPVRIEVDANTNVIVEKQSLYVGGKGLERDVKIIVSPKTPGTKTISIKVIDERTGDVIGETSYIVNVVGKVAKQKPEEVEKPKETVIDILSNKTVLTGIVALLIIIVALYIIFSGRRKKEEEQPSV